MTPPVTVRLADLEAAARRLRGAIVETPCLPSRTLSALAGCEVVVKFENLQYTASFKDRGALIKLLGLSPRQARGGVIAVSAGNHAQGVAYHAARLGIPATIVMPRTAPFTKVRHTEAFGATVVLEGETIAEAAAVAARLGRARRLTFIPPFDDPAIIAGQGTVAIEMLAAYPDLDALVVPVGGGGLIAGMAVAAKALKPEIEIVGVEAELYPALYRARGGRKPATGGQTIAEGIAVQTIGKLPLQLAKRLVDDVILVSESDIERAILLYLEVEKTVAEGAGAAPLAAVLKRRRHFRRRKVGLVLSGGNIDSRLLAAVIMRGLVRDGRVVRLRVEALDTPGTLAAVTRVIGEGGGNIIDVHHQRLFSDVPIKAADLDLMVETRDARQARAILAGLKAAGFRARLLSDRVRGD